MRKALGSIRATSEQKGTRVHVIDIDPNLLHRSANAALHAANQAWTHIDGETKDDIPALHETLTEH